jgi:AraC family transcriptional regulator
MRLSPLSNDTPALTSNPEALGILGDFSKALTDWLAAARFAIRSDPLTAERYWDQFEALLLQNAPSPGTSNGAKNFATGLAPWQAARVTRYVDANLKKRLPTSELAALVRLSTGHFSRAFKAKFGCPPHEYIIQRRIAKAKAFMRAGELPLAQIALECGLADQAHLSRLFRRLVGTCPSAWRRELGIRQGCQNQQDSLTELYKPESNVQERAP